MTSEAAIGRYDHLRHSGVYFTKIIGDSPRVSSVVRPIFEPRFVGASPMFFLRDDSGIPIPLIPYTLLNHRPSRFHHPPPAGLYGDSRRE